MIVNLQEYKEKNNIKLKSIYLNIETQQFSKEFIDAVDSVKDYDDLDIVIDDFGGNYKEILECINVL